MFTKENIDKNNSGNQATKHFHGTSVCAFQSLMSSSEGTSRNDNNYSTTEISDYTLTQSYTDTPHILKKCRGYTCPLPTVNIPDDICDNLMLNSNRIEETLWMENVLSPDTTLQKSQSSHHAGKHRASIPPPCNKAILPLLRDVVHKFDMQHHLITNKLNPLQVTAVDCSDQPIYALSKMDQWLYPEF